MPVRTASLALCLVAFGVAPRGAATPPAPALVVTAGLEGAACPDPALPVVPQPFSAFEKPEPCTRNLTLDDIGLRLFTDAAALKAAGYALAQAVDFTRDVLLVPRGATRTLAPAPANASLKDHRTEVRVGPPCPQMCGGASSTQLFARECLLKHQGEAYVLARPLHVLHVVRWVPPPCNPALP